MAYKGLVLLYMTDLSKSVKFNVPLIYYICFLYYFFTKVQIR